MSDKDPMSNPAEMATRIKTLEALNAELIRALNGLLAVHLTRNLIVSDAYRAAKLILSKCEASKTK